MATTLRPDCPTALPLRSCTSEWKTEESESYSKLKPSCAWGCFHFHFPRCAWGCRGQFMPARYNSSRAKCIKCSFCRFYFSSLCKMIILCAASSSPQTSLSSTLTGWLRVENISSLMRPTSTHGGDTSDCWETLRTRLCTPGRMSR